MNFLVCKESLFSKEGLLKNIGFYIIIIIFIMHLINIIIFYVMQLDLLKNKIEDIIYAIKNLK